MRCTHTYLSKLAVRLPDPDPVPSTTLALVAPCSRHQSKLDCLLIMFMLKA